jgi:hypothetical protein
MEQYQIDHRHRQDLVDEMDHFVHQFQCQYINYRWMTIRNHG